MSGKGASGEALSVFRLSAAAPLETSLSLRSLHAQCSSQGPAIRQGSRRRLVFNFLGHRTVAPPHTEGNTKPPLLPTLSVGQGNTWNRQRDRRKTTLQP